MTILLKEGITYMPFDAWKHEKHKLNSETIEVLDDLELYVDLLDSRRLGEAKVPKVKFNGRFLCSGAVSWIYSQMKAIEAIVQPSDTYLSIRWVVVGFVGLRVHIPKGARGRKREGPGEQDQSGSHVLCLNRSPFSPFILLPHSLTRAPVLH